MRRESGQYVINLPTFWSGPKICYAIRLAPVTQKLTDVVGNGADEKGVGQYMAGLQTVLNPGPYIVMQDVSKFPVKQVLTDAIGHGTGGR